MFPAAKAAGAAFGRQGVSVFSQSFMLPAAAHFLYGRRRSARPMPVRGSLLDGAP